MGFGLGIEAGHERVRIGISPDPGGIEIEFPAPDEPRLLTEIDNLLEKALEDVDPEPLADPSEAGVVGQVLVEGVAEGVSGGLD
jgi:hypothetical protein